MLNLFNMMNSSINNDGIVPRFNRSSIWNFLQKDRTTYRQTIRSNYKSFEWFQIIEICLLILILFEQIFIFLLTFRKKLPKTNPRKENERSVLLPPKSFLYSCLHRNWIRAFSFSNICLSFVYFLTLILKHYHPNLVHHSSITFYSLPLNLLQQILINFSTFHLFIISISVFQYFLRYYRLLKNTYSSYFFNGRNLLLTKHTNVALILSGSLALIFAYNFVFYTPQYPETINLLPLVTLNMVLLPLINLIIFSFISICFIISIIYFKPINEQISIGNEQEILRLMIEKNTCIKCYSKILEKNPNLFQDKNYSYRNLYRNFFSTHLRSPYPFQIQHNSSQTGFSYEQDQTYETNHLFDQTTLIKLNHQHSLCHLCYYLLLIFLFKYIVFTFPQYIIQMIVHLKQFSQFLSNNDSSKNLDYSLYEYNETFLITIHFLFLLSRLGDSFLFIRLPYLIKKYFPCWCHINSQLLHQEQISHQILTTKNSESSNNEPISPLDISNTNEFQQQESIEISHWPPKNRRFRLQFQFVPLWSHNRPRLFKENI